MSAHEHFGRLAHQLTPPRRAVQGVGSMLLAGFVASTEEAGVWTIQSSIFAENTASLRLHERHGFQVVGVRERIDRAAVGPYAGATQR